MIKVVDKLLFACYNIIAFNWGRKIILYFHGFASVGYGPKFEALRNRFAGRTSVYAPTLPSNPAKVADVVRKIVKDELYADDGSLKKKDPLVFMGTSLGGFYSMYFAQQWGCHAVALNPSTRASKSLTYAIGMRKDFYGNDFDFGQTDINELARMEDLLFRIGEMLPAQCLHLFVTEDDDVIPYKQTLDDIKHRQWLHIFKDGGHRQEAHFDEVIDYVDNTFFGPDGFKDLVEPVFDKKGNLV